jgi:hypothetical protein
LSGFGVTPREITHKNHEWPKMSPSTTLPQPDFRHSCRGSVPQLALAGDVVLFWRGLDTHRPINTMAGPPMPLFGAETLVPSSSGTYSTHIWPRIDVCCGSMAILGHGAVPAHSFTLRIVAVGPWMGGGGGGTASIDIFAVVCGPERWINCTMLPYWRLLLE